MTEYEQVTEVEEMRARLDEARVEVKLLENDAAVKSLALWSAHAEIERLTRERDFNLRGVTNAILAGGEACDDLHAEIERLRAAIVAHQKGECGSRDLSDAELQSLDRALWAVLDGEAGS